MAITKKQITEALHRGVRTASKNYGEWSDGLRILDKTNDSLGTRGRQMVRPQAMRKAYLWKG